MGYFRNLARAFFGRKPEPVEHHHHHIERRQLREADDNNGAFRAVSGGSWRRKVADMRRDSSWSDYDRHLVTCQELWKEHPVAKKGIGNIRAFVAGEGFVVRSTCTNRKKRRIIQREIEKHFKRNAWPEDTPKRAETLAVEGEWNWYVNPVNPADGHFTIGKVNPEDITEIQMLENNREQPEVALLRDIWSETRYSVDGIVSKREFQQMEIVRRHPDGRLRGNLLHLSINDLSGQSRGYSDLFAVADYLDQLDHVIDNETERIRVQRAFVWRCLLKGKFISPEALAQRKQEIKDEGTPDPGTILVSDESEDWSTIAPQLNLMETIKFAEFLLMLIFGGLNMPPHWFADGGDVNKATAGEMSAPVYALVRDRKQVIMQFLMMEHELALFTLLDAGMFDIYGITEEDLTIEVISRDPERSSYSEIGKMLTEVAAALKAGTDGQYISASDAARAYRTAATQLGLGEFEEIDPSDVAPDEDMDTAQAAVAESLEKYRAKPPKRGWLSCDNHHWIRRAA